MKKIGLSNSGFKLTEENLRLLRESGVDAIEISMPLDALYEMDYEAVGKMAKRNGIALWSYHLPFLPFSILDISSPDEALRAGTVKIYGEMIKKAAKIGIDKFVVHPSMEPIPAEERETRIVSAMRSLSELAEIADCCGAFIAVEDLPRTCLGNTAEEMERLLSANEKLRVCFDTNHLTQDTNENFIARLGKKIVTVHISDYDFIDEKHWLCGEGKVDFISLLSSLEKAGYTGVWLYEVGLKTPPTIQRPRDLCFADFVKNANEIFAGKTPSAIA